MGVKENKANGTPLWKTDWGRSRHLEQKYDSHRVVEPQDDPSQRDRGQERSRGETRQLCRASEWGERRPKRRLDSGQ